MVSPAVIATATRDRFGFLSWQVRADHAAATRGLRRRSVFRSSRQLSDHGDEPGQPNECDDDDDRPYNEDEAADRTHRSYPPTHAQKEPDGAADRQDRDDPSTRRMWMHP